MRALGLRAEKDQVHWAVVDGSATEPRLAAHDKFKANPSFTEAQNLRHFRTQLHQLMLEYKPDSVAVRLAETFLQQKPNPTALQSMFERARIEGVMLEIAEASGARVHSGKMAMMRSGLKTKSAKAYLSGDDLRGLDWSTIKNDNRREAGGRKASRSSCRKEVPLEAD